MNDELARAKADEQQVRVLFTDAAAFFATGEGDEVAAELAHSAVAHLGLADTTVYRLDHDQGLIVGVKRAIAAPDGTLRLEDLRGHALKNGEPAVTSGKQELYEQLVNRCV